MKNDVNKNAILLKTSIRNKENLESNQSVAEITCIDAGSEFAATDYYSVKMAHLLE